MTADKYMSADYPPATSKFETDEANAKRNYHIVYNAKTSDYEKITKVSKERKAGYIFIRNDEFPDPFNALPGDYNHMVDLATNGTNKKPQAEAEPKPATPEKKPVEDKSPAAEPTPAKKDTKQKDQSTPSSTPAEEPKPTQQDSLADTGINSFLIAGGVVVLLSLGTSLIIFNKKRIARKK